MKSIRCLSGAVLKYIAMISMLADHCNIVFFESRMAQDAASWMKVFSVVLDVFGRFAFPIFFFLLVEGFFNTRNRWRYLCNLLLFGIVSEIPFNLFVGTNWLYSQAQNILFTLVIALGVIWAIDWVRGVTEHWLVIMLPITAVGCIGAHLCKVDYGGMGVLIPLAFYLFRSKPVAAAAVGYCTAWGQFWSLPSFLMTMLYNGQRGRQYKWLNYWFYPMHLMILGLIRLSGKM